MGFDYAVEHGLDRTAGNPIVVVSVAHVFDGVDLIGGQARRIEKVGDVETQAELSIAAQLVVQIEELKISPRAVDAYQAKFIGFMHSQS